MPFQCWMALSLWQIRDVPELFFTEVGEGRDVQQVKLAVKGAGVRSLLLCVDQGRRLIVWDMPAVRDVPGEDNALAPPVPDGVQEQRCRQLALHPYSIGGMTARQYPYTVLFLAICAVATPRFEGPRAGELPSGGSGFTRFVNSWLGGRTCPRPQELCRLAEFVRDFLRHIQSQGEVTSQGKKPTSCAEVVCHDFSQSRI